MLGVAIVFVIFLQSAALHLHDTQQQILSADFDKTFANLKNQLDFTSRQYSLNNAQKYKPMINACDSIASSGIGLHDYLLKNNLPISLTTKLCPGISTINRTQLTTSTGTLQNNLQILKDLQDECQTCNFVQKDVDTTVTQYQAYIKQVNKTLDQAYCANKSYIQEYPAGLVDINQSFFKSNLNANNWIYGNTTAVDYKLKVFKRVASYNMTNCPLKLPYTKSLNGPCFNCPAGSFFNLGKEECTFCPLGTIVNKDTSLCEKCDGQIITNADKTVYCKPCNFKIGEIFNVTSGKCYNCTAYQSYDQNLKICVNIICPTDKPIYNTLTKECQPCTGGIPVTQNNITKCIQTNYIGICPYNTPVYNYTTKLCEGCPNGTVYNKSANVCQQNATIICAEPTPKYLPLTNTCEACPVGYMITPTDNTKCQKNPNYVSMCPPSTPIYDSTSRSCQPCPAGLVYIPSLGSCK